MPNGKPKVTVVAIAKFEYLSCRPGFLRVGLNAFPRGELAIQCSQTPLYGQDTHSSAVTRLVHPAKCW